MVVHFKTPSLLIAILLIGAHAAHAVQTPPVKSKPVTPKTKRVSVDRKPGFTPIQVAYPSKREEPIARIGSSHSQAEVEAQASN